MKQSAIKTGKLDFLGFWASMLCAIHCAVTPLLLTLSALGSLAFLAEPSIEEGIILVSVILALCSLAPSWRKHKNWGVLILALLGFVCIAVGHELGHELNSIYPEAILATLGGLSVAVAHLWNARAIRNTLS